MGGLPAHRLACRDCYPMKTERYQLRFFGLFLFLMVVLSFSSASFAAVTVTPVVDGYRPHPTGGYFSSKGAWVPYVPASNSYTGTGSFNVGGKTITVPNKIPIAATAGNIAKAGMRANPYVLAGTLALPWLLEHGMKWVDGEGWTIGGPTYKPALPDEDITACGTGNFYFSRYGGSCTVQTAACRDNGLLWTMNNGNAYCSDEKTIPIPYFVIQADKATEESWNPATDADWDALPNPIPDVAPELPDVDYMPSGVPANKPTYDFEPFNQPTGEPYKKPDGSTVQPWVTVSSNTTTVTYNTYNLTIINAAGEPVTDPVPTDENADEVDDPCEANPERVGCVDLGTPTDDQDFPRVEMPLTFQPVAIQQDATCPAPMTVSAFGKSILIAYDGACTYASGLKPIVIAVAYLSALLIIFGVPRATNG